MIVSARCRTCEWTAVSAETAKVHARKRGHEVEVVWRDVFCGTTCVRCDTKTLHGLWCLECGGAMCEACWSTTDGRHCE